MSLGELQALLSPEHAQYRHVRVLLQGPAQLALVAGARGPVEDDPGEPHLGVELPVAEHQGGDPPGRSLAVQDQDHRRPEGPGQRGIAVGAVRGHPVVQSLVPLDDGETLGPPGAGQDLVV